MLTVQDHLTQVLEAPQIDPVLLSVANLYIAGNSTTDIAEQLNVSPDRVIQVLDNERVKTYINTSLQTQGYLNPFRRLQIINKVIEDKLTKAVEEGYTNKDLLDWLEHARKMEESTKPKKGPTVAVQVNNNYDRLMKELNVE